jgi:hypothetical protein
MNHIPASTSIRIPTSTLRAVRPPRRASPEASDREAYIQSLARLRAKGRLPIDPVAIADAILRREQPHRTSR